MRNKNQEQNFITSRCEGQSQNCTMAKYKVKVGVGIIPKGTIVIEKDAFGDPLLVLGEREAARSIVQIVIPKTVTKIDKSAFYECIYLTSVVIPDSVTRIGWHAFAGCKSMKAINVFAKNGKYNKELLPEELHSFIV